MSIQFGNILGHNNPNYPIVDVTDVKGGLRSIATFSDAALLSEYTSGAGGTEIPEKYKSGYSLLLETSTDSIYYLSGMSATTSSDWSLIGGGSNVSGLSGSGITNSVAIWITPNELGSGSIIDNGDTVIINANLQVIGTTSTINAQNLTLSDPIILLAGSQSGTPLFDCGLLIERGDSDSQAFIWDESEDEFRFFTTISSATVSGNVIIGTYSSVRTGVLSVGTGSRANSRFLVSSSGGTVSLVVDESGNVYNNGRGGIATNTVFGASALSLNSSGYQNTAIGVSSLLLNTTGHANVAIGSNSLSSNISGNRNTTVGALSLYFNTTGSDNVALGYLSLYRNTTGYWNTAIGYQSLYSNTTGFSNTALGYQSLYSNTTGVILNTSSFTSGNGYVDGEYTVQLVYATGSTFLTAPLVEIEIIGGEVVYVGQISSYGTGFKDTTTTFTINSYGIYSSVGSGFEIGVIALLNGNNNVALGKDSLYSNTIGSSNVALGKDSLFNNNTGSNNTAIGYQSLYDNTTGDDNTAIGYVSLASNTTGRYNTAIGLSSLYSNTTGQYNTAIGNSSLSNNTTGSDNIAIGRNALYNNANNENIAIGRSSLYNSTTGYWNTAIGIESLTSNTAGYWNTAIGAYSLQNNTTGWASISLGYNSLQYNTTGDRNNAIGYWSMRYYRGLWSTAIGGNSLQLASQAINTLTATFSPGTGYTPGIYPNVRLVWSSGTFWQPPTSQTWEYPTAEIVVGPGGTVSSVTLKFRGVLIPDTTTRFTAQTGTQSYQLGAASGSGFSIGIATIATASWNNALGHGSLGNLGVGQLNIGIGMWAGIYHGTQSDPLSGSDQSIFIGTFTSALNNDSFNEIVIGHYANGNGNNTVTLGNDSVVATYLKGAVYVGKGSVNSNDRLIVSSSGGTVSLVVDELGNVYNNGRGGIATNAVFGASALSLNSGGYENTAIGVNALLSNLGGNFNTALGYNALILNTSGSSNTAVGDTALYFNTSGISNTALGNQSLQNNITGSNNVALGSGSGRLTIAGSGVTSSNNSIFIGNDTRPQLGTQSNQIVIGHGATGNGSNSVTLGNNTITRTYLKGKVVIADGTQGVGKILTSDATGLSSWATASTGSVTNVTGTLPISVINPTTSPVISVANASGTQSGVITTSTQTIAGLKTFTNNLAIDGSSSSNMFFQINGSGTGTITSTTGFFQFDAFNSSGYLFKNGAGSNVLSIDQAGTTVFSALSGSGTRMVTVTSTGQLGAQAITTGTVTSVTGNLPISVSNNTTTPVISVANASDTQSGVITTGAQTIAGVKTFNALSFVGTGNRMVVVNTSGTLSTQAIPTSGTGTVTSVSSTAPITVTGTNTIAPVIGVADASASTSGVITTGAQTIAGVKRFSNIINVGNTATVVYSTIGENYIDIHDGNDVTTGWIRHASAGSSRFKNNLSTNLLFSNPIANTTLNLPAKTVGTYTLATIEDLGNYVTLTGASQTITGRKELNNSVNGISLNFSVTGTGTGINMTNTGTGYAINSWNQSTGPGIRNLTTGSGNGIQATSDGPGTALYVLNSANSTGTGLLIYNNITATGMPLVVQKNSVDKFTVSDNGTVTAATGFFVSSDARLKDVIERDGDTVKFTWKDKRDDKTHIGYIAQEVQEKYPDQVNKNEDGMLTVNYIEVLVAKIQELENRIKQLEK